MKFDYRYWPSGSSPAFPQRIRFPRPTILVKVQYQEKTQDIYALVDSGADYCMFPSEVGEQLGIDVNSGKEDTVIGIGNQPYTFYFHNIDIIVGGHKNEAWAGFSDRVPWPLLGQEGFFDRFEVKFNFRKKRVEIKPY